MNVFEIQIFGQPIDEAKDLLESSLKRVKTLKIDRLVIKTLNNPERNDMVVELVNSYGGTVVRNMFNDNVLIADF